MAAMTISPSTISDSCATDTTIETKPTPNTLLQSGYKMNDATMTTLPLDQKYDQEIVTFFQTKIFPGVMHCYVHRIGLKPVSQMYAGSHKPAANFLATKFTYRQRQMEPEHEEVNSILNVHMVIHEEANQPGFVRMVSDAVTEYLKEYMRIRVFVNGVEPGVGMGLVDAETAWKEC